MIRMNHKALSLAGALLTSFAMSQNSEAATVNVTLTGTVTAANGSFITQIDVGDQATVVLTYDSTNFITSNNNTAITADNHISRNQLVIPSKNSSFGVSSTSQANASIFTNILNAAIAGNDNQSDDTFSSNLSYSLGAGQVAENISTNLRFSAGTFGSSLSTDFTLPSSGFISGTASYRGSRGAISLNFTGLSVTTAPPTTVDIVDPAAAPTPTAFAAAGLLLPALLRRQKRSTSPSPPGM